MQLLLSLCLILIISSSIVSGVITVLSVVAIFGPNVQETTVEKAKTGFYIYSVICLANLVLWFVMTLPEKGLQFDYPITLLVGVLLEVAFLSYICRVVVKSELE